jgi:cell division septation protein DedD
MRAFVDDEEDRYEKPKRSRDVEMTLGGGTVVLFVLGLLLVCGLCFGAGYFVGHRAPAQVATDAGTAAGSQSSSQAGGSIPKPSANSQPVAPPPVVDASQAATDAQPGTGDAQLSAAAVTIPAVSAPGANRAAAPAVTAPQARPAPQAASAPAASQAAAQAQAHPAAAPPQTHAASAPTAGAQLMVQIAAVSHPEDAEVLIGALRKHGYTVTARHESDNLIHERIGPFRTHDEAESWRLKLLNDGYNAMIQP